MHWQQFKTLLEARWRYQEEPSPNHVWFCTPRSGTRWNPGMTVEEVDAFEASLGFALPIVYREMLAVINGFDRTQITYRREEDDQGNYYFEIGERLGACTYPCDWPAVQPLLNDIKDCRDDIDAVISGLGLNPADITGFIPLIAHRVMVVLKDIHLSPVVSFIPGDAILYGRDLREFMLRDFELKDPGAEERLIRCGRIDAAALGKLERARGGRVACKRRFRFLFETDHPHDACDLKLAIERCGHGEATMTRLENGRCRVTVAFNMAADQQAMTMVSGLMLTLAREASGRYLGWEGGELADVAD